MIRALLFIVTLAFLSGLIGAYVDTNTGRGALIGMLVAVTVLPLVAWLGFVALAKIFDLTIA